MIRVTPRQADLLVPEWEGMAVPQPEPAPKKASPEDVFAAQCRQFRLPPVERQLMFAKERLGRRWMFDFAWRQYMVAVELEGLIPLSVWKAKLDGPVPIVSGGRVVNVIECTRLPVVLGGHASVTGIKRDMEKGNAASLLGWTVLRFEQKDIKPRHAIEMTIQVLAARGWRREES